MGSIKTVVVEWKRSGHEKFQMENRAEKLIQCGTLTVRGAGRETHWGGMSFGYTAFKGLVMV